MNPGILSERWLIVYDILLYLVYLVFLENLIYSVPVCKLLKKNYTTHHEITVPTAQIYGKNSTNQVLTKPRLN